MRSTYGTGGARHSGFYWTVSPALIADNLDKWWDNFLKQVDLVITSFGARILEIARSTHPWQNITGAAERALNVAIIREANAGRAIVLYYDPSSDPEGSMHGFWMEIRWNGVYGVIRTVLEGQYDAIFEAIRALLKG